MSGHSKWASIKHKKGAADAKRGKVFTKHAKLITIAAQGGGDPDSNPALRAAIDIAKKDNLPNDNVARAIKKGTGADKNAAAYSEVIYEGYGVGGVAMLVEVLTDNKNRTVASIRHAFTKNGGTLGSSGSVAFMFARKGVIVIDNASDDLEMAAIEAGAEDVEVDDGMMIVTTEFAEFNAVRDAMSTAGASIVSAEVQQIPSTMVAVDDEKAAGQVLRLVEALEADDDVSAVAHNAEVSEELMAELG